MSEWPPERLRALDRAVAEARGWTRCHITIRTGRDRVGWRAPNGDEYLEPTPVSLGCRETFDLMDEEKIEAGFAIRFDSPTRVPRAWRRDSAVPDCAHEAPTIPIAVCLSYLESKGRPFNG